MHSEEGSAIPLLHGAAVPESSYVPNPAHPAVFHSLPSSCSRTKTRREIAEAKQLLLLQGEKETDSCRALAPAGSEAAVAVSPYQTLDERFHASLAELKHLSRRPASLLGHRDLHWTASHFPLPFLSSMAVLIPNPMGAKAGRSTAPDSATCNRSV